jgi:hypothetical protein
MQPQHVRDRVAFIRNKTKVTMYVHGDLTETEAWDLYQELDQLYFGSTAASHAFFDVAEFKRLQSLGSDGGNECVGNELDNHKKNYGATFQNIKLVASQLQQPSTADSVSAAGEVVYEVPARSRLLIAQPAAAGTSGNSSSHRRVILPAFNPSDPNSALITYFQVTVCTFYYDLIAITDFYILFLLH